MAHGPVYFGLKAVGPYIEPLFHDNGQILRATVFTSEFVPRCGYIQLKGNHMSFQKYHGPCHYMGICAKA